MIRLAVLPLRLNLDQDTMDFLVAFFAFKHEYDQTLVRVEHPARAPVPPFIKLCVISPIIANIDYDPKHLALSSLFRGNLGEMAGLMSLRQATLALPATAVKGVAGFDTLAVTVAQQWLASYSETLPGILSGVPFVRPVHNVVRASSQVLSQPLANYPRVLQGFRQGLFGTVTTTTVEFCNVSTALLIATRNALESAQSMITGTFVDNTAHPSQPVDVRAGLRAAGDVLREGLGRMWPGSRRQRTTVRSVLGALPAATLQPFITACDSVSIALQGFRNSLHPDTRKDLEAKYRRV